MSATIEQINTLNNLLGILAGSDGNVRLEMRRAIRFAAQSYREGASLVSLGQCARRMIRLHWQGRPVTLLHCDLRDQTHEPLWLHSRVAELIASVKPGQDAILLVSGLRESIAAKGRRWTRRRESEYAAARDYLETLCAYEQPFGVRLNVIFL